MGKKRTTPESQRTEKSAVFKKKLKNLYYQNNSEVQEKY